MQIISRRQGEAVAIGDELEVIVLSVNGNQARIGVKAPKSIAAHRTEIFRKILMENGVAIPAGLGGAACTPDLAAKAAD